MAKAEWRTRIAKMAEEIVRTENYSSFNEMWDLARQHDVFVSECEDGIMVEDDYFRFR